MYLDLVSDDPQQEEPFHIIEKATKMLEAEIIKQPQYWLWTHRRWKRKRPVEAA
jgi:KDO2-lipid IV(A) lauroyltransferase